MNMNMHLIHTTGHEEQMKCYLFEKEHCVRGEIAKHHSTEKSKPEHS